MLHSIDPSTGRKVASYEEHTLADLHRAVLTAHEQHKVWSQRRFAERATVLRAAADRLDATQDELATLMADEMGKPVRQGRAEATKCANACRYYADNAARILADRPVTTERYRSFVHHEPLGVILAVMPWNFPLWQVFRFAAPALMAGNAGLLKHASNVSGCALAIEDLLLRAGCPEGLFRALLVGSDAVESVLEEPLVRAATLTGSAPAGAAVAAKAGSLLKKTVLELGGSDAYLVLHDADVAAAAAVCAESRLLNSGQSCICAKRFVVVESVYDDFVERFVAEMSAPAVGDPHADSTELGPLARHDLRDEVHDQVLRSVAAGAKILLGGELPPGAGAFYPPTVLVDVAPGSPAAQEEIFGPVASVFRVPDEEEAIRVANDTPFGLGAAVFTADVERGERIAAQQLDAGCCFVNALVASDPRLPFGGIKDSGYGRELSDLGIREFVNAKTVVVDRP